MHLGKRTSGLHYHFALSLEIKKIHSSIAVQPTPPHPTIPPSHHSPSHQSTIPPPTIPFLVRPIWFTPDESNTNVSQITTMSVAQTNFRWITLARMDHKTVELYVNVARDVSWKCTAYVTLFTFVSILTVWCLELTMLTARTSHTMRNFTKMLFWQKKNHSSNIATINSMLHSLLLLIFFKILSPSFEQFKQKLT